MWGHVATWAEHIVCSLSAIQKSAAKSIRFLENVLLSTCLRLAELSEAVDLMMSLALDWKPHSTRFNTATQVNVSSLWTGDLCQSHKSLLASHDNGPSDSQKTMKRDSPEGHLGHFQTYPQKAALTTHWLVIWLCGSIHVWHQKASWPYTSKLEWLVVIHGTESIESIVGAPQK